MDKSVIVTGAAQGIGRIIVSVLLAQGYRVIAIDIDAAALTELENEHKRHRIICYKGDVADEFFVEHVITREQQLPSESWGLVNNAAITQNKDIAELTLKQWQRVLDVNLAAPFLWAKHLSPVLKSHKGAIVNICSTRAFMSEPNTEAYSASKGGLLALTHSLAISLAPVRVNAISPGWIETRDLQKKENVRPYTHSEKDASQHPVGRVGNAFDVAYMVSYLLSDRAGFITGQNFVVDGGMTSKMIYEE
ncbi:MAG: hypothetical protein RIS47_2201 [Bacteroidota bacterium]|jgi:NAD(P)-dependent dehydrogenase (short-subunit alcohol dehydrogenase family)